jgi:hypothetical protein
MAFVHLLTRLQDLLLSYGVLEIVDRDHFYASIPSAVAEIREGERRVGDSSAEDEPPTLRDGGPG